MSNKTVTLKVKRGFLDTMTRGRFVPPEGILALLVEELPECGEQELKNAASFIIRTRKYPTWPTVAEIIEALETVRLQDGKNWRDQDAKKVFIEYGTPQWWAWDVHTRKTANPHGLPTTTNRDTGKKGWRCLSEWPPGASPSPGSFMAKRVGEIDHSLKIELRKRACRRINNTSLPQIADREGWLHGLIDFVVAHDRMPDKNEQAELKRVADGIEANLKALALLKPLPKAKGWGTLGGMGSVEGLRAFRKIMKLRAHREVFGEPDYTRGLGLDLNRDREFFDTEAKAFADAMGAAPDAT